ncbi:helix-turn-helix domain-containing protein [Streptomyces sp. NPDC023838]|uniref:helix-turn-helix domain-containing protein n=1 Tax=Streptomyces sp. NPDC023838 TaxID=3154325 RepID=UPI0033CE46DA
MSTTRPMLNQREAAAACGVSRTTIRRRREEGALPNAVQDPQRGWLIPVEDLLAAGFRLNAPAGPDPDASPAGVVGHGGQHQGDDVAALRAELERVRHEHDLALARADFERQLAQKEAEHLRVQLEDRAERIQDLQRALAALTPAPERTGLATSGAVVPEQGRPGPAVPADTGSEEPRRRWWGGRRR